MENTKPGDLIVTWFDSSHLPEHLQVVVRDFEDLANRINNSFHSPEATVALRKLLEAKDAAVRAAIYEAKKAEA